MDFEADYFFSISKFIKFPYIAHLKYCEKLDFEADYFFLFHFFLISLYSTIKILQKSGDPNNKHLGVTSFYY